MSAEQAARQNIDELLRKAGWHVCGVAAADLHAARGVAIREFPLSTGFGFADYMLYVDGQAAGVIEAKKEGATLTGVEIQSGRYAKGLPASLPAWRRPLAFLYESRGVETHFTNGVDPEPRANVQRGYLDLAEVKEIEAPAVDIEELRLVPGDILFNEGGDRDKLGRGWIWEGQITNCIHLIAAFDRVTMLRS